MQSQTRKIQSNKRRLKRSAPYAVPGESENSGDANIFTESLGTEDETVSVESPSSGSSVSTETPMADPGSTETPMGDANSVMEVDSTETPMADTGLGSTETPMDDTGLGSTETPMGNTNTVMDSTETPIDTGIDWVETPMENTDPVSTETPMENDDPGSVDSGIDLVEAPIDPGIDSVEPPTAGIESTLDDDSKIESRDPPEHDEYYPFCKYARTANGREIYARKSSGEEMELRDKNDQPLYIAPDGVNNYNLLFPRDESGKPRYIMVDRDEIYPLNCDGEPVYLVLDGKQVYAKNYTGGEYYATHPVSGTQTYAKDENGNYYFARKDNDRQYYAVTLGINGTLVQSPPMNDDGKAVYIRSRDEKRVEVPIDPNTNLPVYRKTATGEEEYEKDENGNEYYFTDAHGRGIYGLGSLGRQKLALMANGRPIYADDGEGNEYYPRDEFGNEYYMVYGKTNVPAYKQDGIGFYAKNIAGGEFYPMRWE